MGIYLNGIHISRKLSTEKGNYAQRSNIADGGDYLHNCSSLAQKLNSSALFNGGTSAPLLAIYCWQQLNFKSKW